jgi:Protein of unknown function (DUF4238)
MHNNSVKQQSIGSENTGMQQHYVPQRLLKNFLISPKKDRIHWYRKDKTINNITIKRVFKEKYYYGEKESEYFADKVVSDGEIAIINPLLSNLVMMEGLLNKQDSKRVCDFIAHFALRRSINRNLLSTIAAEYCMDDDLSLDKILNSFKPISLKIPSSRMLQHNYFFRIYLTQFIMNSCIDFLKEILAIHTKNSRNNLKSQSRDAHNKIIIAEDNHQLVAESLNYFQWVVLKSQHCLILGDTVCFFENQDDEFFPFDNGIVKNIYMPISSQKLLVGFKGSHPPQVNFDQINHQNARCCYNSFVCSEKSDEIQALVSLIGENFKPVQQKVFKSVNSSINYSIFSQFSAHFVENSDGKQMLDCLRDKMSITKQKSLSFNKINLAILLKVLLRFRS